MTLSQWSRLDLNSQHLRAIEQNLDALFAESGAAPLRRAQEAVLRAIEHLSEVDVERRVA